MNVNNVLIQGVGYLALFFVILSFQKNKRRLILLYLAIAQVFFAIHFALLNAWTGVALDSIAAFRTFIFYKKETKSWGKNIIWYYLFLILFGLSGLFVWEGYHSLLPALAMIIDTVALWKENTKSIRFIMLTPRLMWFAYNFIVGSQAGMVTEIMVLLSVIIGIIRFDVLRKEITKNN